MAVKKNKGFRYRRKRNKIGMVGFIELLAFTQFIFEWEWQGNYIISEHPQIPIKFCPLTALHWMAEGDLKEYYDAYKVFRMVAKRQNVKPRIVRIVLDALEGYGSERLQYRIAQQLGMQIDPEFLCPDRGSPPEPRFLFLDKV